MKKIAVVFLSGTGNTQIMAEEIASEIRNKNIDVDLLKTSEFSKDYLEKYDGFTFGCPAMGDEELEQTEFEPMFSDIEKNLSDKPVLIFGSYEWANGEWMKIWQERCENLGINLVRDGLIAYDKPNDTSLKECRDAADKLIEAI